MIKTNGRCVYLWILRLVIAAILLQTLYFKFTAAEESVYIFSKLHMEPYGRIGTGIAELIAVILLLIPRTTLLGALLAAGIMAGAILSHLLVLGTDVKNDGGLLFILALTVFMCSILLIFESRKKIPLLQKFKL